MTLLVERKELKQKKAQWIVPSAYARGIFIGANHTVKNTFRKILLCIETSSEICNCQYLLFLF